MQQKALEQGLSRDELMALKNKRTGVTVFQISWILVFVCLIVVNLQLRSNFPSWPPADVDELSMTLPTIATVGLLVSVFFARRGLQAMRADQLPSFLQSWGVALLLGAGFILIMAYEWVTVQISGQYSSVFRVMTAFHAFHALVIGWIMFVVYKNARAGLYDATRHWAVEAAAKMWYFVVVAWIMFYTVLYII